MSKRIFPGSSAAWLPFLAVTFVSASNPSGTEPAFRVSMLWAWVRAETKLLPGAARGPTLLAAWATARAAMAPPRPWAARGLDGSRLSTSS